MNTMQLFFSFVFKGPVGPRGPQGLQGQQVSLFIIKSHTVKKKKEKEVSSLGHDCFWLGFKLHIVMLRGPDGWIVSSTQWT